MRACLLLVLGLLVGLAASRARAAGKQQARKLDREITVRVKLNYLLYLPKGYDAKAEKRWPLLLFLHGLGESGTDLNRVKVHGPPKLIDRGKDFPFIVVSPQCPGFGWDVPALAALLDEVQESHKVDPDRVYVTGLSMGGFGTFAFATAYPERVAAIAPICGGGEPIFAHKMRKIPAWVFHGAKDEAVPVARSEEMVKALKRARADVRLTVYPDLEHDSWTATYDNPELYEWLLRQSRGAGPKK
jgi:predicted peptidase